MHLRPIDVLQQTFDAKIYIELRFVGGAQDEDLSNPSAEFPTLADGTPTFRPSAEWFVQQLDVNNGVNFEFLSRKVRTPRG